MFFSLTTAALAAVLVAIVGVATLGGLLLGRFLRERGGQHREPVGVVQGTLLGFLGLLLAFGLTMAVSRYDARRTILVEEANAIGTTYLRAQLLPEPLRTTSLDLLRRWGDEAVSLAEQTPNDPAFGRALVVFDDIEAKLWQAAGDAVHADQTGTAPRLYVESLNAMIDAHGDRVSSLGNRVPTTVMVLQVFGSAVALFLLALYLSLLGRGAATALAAAAIVTLILLISFDLDRPHRGLITVPDKALVSARAAMDAPPAYTPPP